MPLAFEKVPWPVVLVAPLATLCAVALAVDGRLSRADGAVLLVGYTLAIAFLAWTGRRGLTVQPAGARTGISKNRQSPTRGRALGLLALSIAGIAVGSMAIVQAAAGHRHDRFSRASGRRPRSAGSAPSISGSEPSQWV